MNKIPRHNPIQGPAAYTPEWHSLRRFDPDRASHRVVIGASEAAAAMNLSPYRSALQLYLEKRGEMPDCADSVEDTEAMEMGLELEPVILNRYEKRTGYSVLRQIPLMFHPEKDWMGATPDGLGYAGDDKWSIDCKAPSDFRYDKTGQDEHSYGIEGTDQVPLDNLMQAQHQMAVLGLERCDFPVLFSGRKLRIYTVDRDDALIAAMMSAEQELVERIINGDPPEPNWEHADTKRCISALYGVQVGTVATLTREMRAMWDRTEELKDVIAAAEKERDALRLRILAESQGAEVVTFEDSPLKLKRIVVAETYVSREDVEAMAAKIGQVKRAGYEYLRKSK